MTPLVVILPGDPHAQKRARAFRLGAFVRVHDAPESRSWKGEAQVHYQEALRAAKLTAPAFAGPVEVTIEAVFALPTTKHRKSPVPRQRNLGAKDVDNIAKAVLDAGNSLLYADDRQVTRLLVEKWTGAQGEAAHVRVTVRSLAQDLAGYQASL